jgi:beta-glucosidase
MADPRESGDSDGHHREIPALVAALTREEKLRLVRGAPPDDATGELSGYLPPVERLGVPALRMADGPLGVRAGEATAFPATLGVGATFDVDLATAFGEALGAEARNKNVDVLLAPGCNLVRVPHCGRAFEYYGEDPHHSARLTAATVRGIQTHDVVATPKHYVANNQERDRTTVSAEVGERALRELYLPAFEAAVQEADAGAVMAAYNRVDGTYLSEHEQLLTTLKSEFGLDGPVVSDWWALEDGVAAARAGLDIEMPGVGLVDMVAMSVEGFAGFPRLRERWPERLPDLDTLFGSSLSGRLLPGGIPRPRESLFAQTLPAALEGNQLSTDRLDEMAARVLRLHQRVGALDGSRRPVTVDRDAHRELAATVGVRGSVLLKNEGVLPLSPDDSVALVGPHVDRANVGGGGSSDVTPDRTVSPAAAVRARSTGDVRVECCHPPVESASGFGRGLSSLTAALRASLTGQSTVDRRAVRRVAAAVETAVVVVQDRASEFRDRETLSLPGEQDRLVAAVADAAPRTVVVLQTAGPVELPWLDAVDAVLECWYPGQEAGRVLARVLYGDADPGGRLPVTFGTAGQYPTTAPANYPGLAGADGYPEAQYAEGVFVGYRYFDERDHEPVFPFGHGRSYAEFAYEDATLADREEQAVSVTLANNGDCRGREVVQLYARDPEPALPRPPRELVGFESVALDPGERRTVSVDVDDRAFAYYDETERDWTVDPGAYTLVVGRSSRETVAELTVSVVGE